MAESHQFSELNLDLSNEQLSQFYELPTKACVNLEVLSVCIRYQDDEVSIFDFHPDKYPRLKSLTIRLEDGPAMCISVIPWRQLTTLRLEVIHSSELKMLRQCVSLEECELEVWLTSSIDSIGEIHLPSLLRFSVTVSDPLLLRVFRFPNLEEFGGRRLKIEDDKKLMLEHFNFLRIRVLKIPDPYSRTNLNFYSLFKLAPSLESVSLPQPKDKNHMHELATGRLGPLLHTIETPYECTCEQILAFAETRWQCVAASNASGSSPKIVPFKRIEFKATDSPTPDHLERQKALQNRGTVIEWISNLYL